MPLSEEEQRKFEEIEAWLTTPDQLAGNGVGRSDLLAMAEQRRRVRVAARWAIWLGMMIMLIGLSASAGLISGGMLVAGYGFFITGTGTVVAIRHRQPTQWSHRNRFGPGGPFAR